MDTSTISQSLTSTSSLELVPTTTYSITTVNSSTSVVEKTLHISKKIDLLTSECSSTKKDYSKALQNNEYVEKYIKENADLNNNNGDSRNIIFNENVANNISDTNVCASNENFDVEYLKEKKDAALQRETISTVASIAMIDKNNALITMGKNQHENLSTFATKNIMNTSSQNFAQENNGEINTEDLYIQYNNEQSQQQQFMNELKEKETDKLLHQQMQREFDDKEEQLHKCSKNFTTNMCDNVSIASALESKLPSIYNTEMMEAGRLQVPMSAPTSYYSKLFLIYK